MPDTGKAADGLCASASVTATCMPCQTVVFAMGHSARDTFRRMYARGIAMTQKPFSVGVRIEHPQDLIDIAAVWRTRKGSWAAAQATIS